VNDFESRSREKKSLSQTKIILYHILCSLALSLAILIIYIIISKLYFSHQNVSKLSPFECGFEPIRKIRTPFSTKFFILIILFVIFDIELALLFPLSYNLFIFTGFIDLHYLIIILVILIAGVFLEWSNGALDWKL
jgi:NADH:ubiquinone oxidoreductase subunit 3 (subunit A)